MSDSKVFYVYAYLREDKTPYYVGKGTRNRITNEHGLVPVPKDKARRVKLVENLTEDAALEEERRLISHYGREVDGGILINLKEGGERGGRPFGYKHTEETKEKMRRSGGHSHTEETKRKITEANLRRSKESFNKSEAHKRKIREGVQRYWDKKKAEAQDLTCK